MIASLDPRACRLQPMLTSGSSSPPESFAAGGAAGPCFRNISYVPQPEEECRVKKIEISDEVPSCCYATMCLRLNVCVRGCRFGRWTVDCVCIESIRYGSAWNEERKARRLYLVHTYRVLDIGFMAPRPPSLCDQAVYGRDLLTRAWKGYVYSLLDIGEQHIVFHKMQNHSCTRK